jgi:hypothetical protein
VPREVAPATETIICGLCRWKAEEKDMAKGRTTANDTQPAFAAGAVFKKPTGTVRRDSYEERLPCRSDDAVVATKARELAKLEHQRTAFRESWKAQCAKARERRAFFEERIEELAAEVDGQVEYRNVEVIEYLLPTNEVIAVRSDTHEVVSTRTAEAEDLQDSIPGTEGKSKKKGKGAEHSADAPAE